jgi:adenylosuccinate lyase
LSVLFPTLQFKTSGQKRLQPVRIHALPRTGENMAQARVRECEMIRMDQINEAFKRMERADVRYRFVIDMASLQGKLTPSEYVGGVTRTGVSNLLESDRAEGHA